MTHRFVAGWTLRALSMFCVAALAWSLLGYFATLPLGALFGWSGHPAVPDAPILLYVVIYLVVLPIGCLYGAWKLIRGAELRWRSEHGASP